MAKKQKQKVKKPGQYKVAVDWLPLPDEHQGRFTPKQAAFLAAYSESMNATQACLKTYDVTKKSAQSFAFKVCSAPYMRAAMKLIQDRYLDSIEPADIMDKIEEQYEKNAFKMRVKKKKVTTMGGEAGLIEQHTEEEIDTNPQALAALQMKIKMLDNIIRARNMANLHGGVGNGQVQVALSVNNQLFDVKI